MPRNLNKVFLCIFSIFLIVVPSSSLAIDKLSPIKIPNFGSVNISLDIIELIQQVNESKLRKHVQTIEDFGPHKTGSEALDHVGKYIYDELNSTKLPVEYFDWSNKKFTGKNIVATLKGVGETDGIIILCAHYDSVKISPGAEDDGSGVAIVLMLAEIMSNFSFNSTIKFILFSGEEQGLLGSKAYAKSAKNNGENIIGVLALDKVGYAVTAEEGGKIKHHSNDKSNWMVDVSIEMAKKYYDYIELDVIRMPQDPASDHLSFVKKGFCGTDFVRYGVNPFYHTSEDKIEHMNITYLTKVCNLTLATVCELSGLNPVLKSNDLKILIKGTYLSKTSQIYIKVENRGYELDTANVTIEISLKHVFIKNEYFLTKKKDYVIPCYWSLTKEIDNSWEFMVGAHTFTKGLCKLNVVVKGINDDIYLYKKVVTIGWIIYNHKVRLIPRF
jgi:hypothetical protein